MKKEPLPINKVQLVTARSQTGKMGILVSIVSITFAYALCVFLDAKWKSTYSILLLPFVLLLTGILHVFIIRKWMQFAVFSADWIYTMATTGYLALLLSMSFLWGMTISVRLVAFVLAAFILPFTLSEMWKAMYYLAMHDLILWFPTREKLKLYPGFYFRSILMRFRILAANGKTQHTIQFSVSKELDLGHIFYDLAVNKYKNKIVLESEHKQYYKWVFYTSEGLLFNRVLDPYKTLEQNGLSENALIYVQHVSEEDLDASFIDTTKKRKHVYNRL